MMKRPLASLGLIMLLVLVACTQPAAPLSTTTPPPTQTQLPSPTPTPAPSTETPALTPTVLSPSPPFPATGMLGEHHVLRGESLSCVGRAYGVLPKAIADANGMALADVLFAGQALKIPSVEWPDIPTGPVCEAQFVSPYSGRAPVFTPALTPIPPTNTVPPATLIAPSTPTPTPRRGP